MKKLFLFLTLFGVICFVGYKVVNFNGGVILGEPDAIVHAQIVESLIHVGRPLYNGRGFYFEMPAYFYTASIFSQLVFKNPLVSLRFVSYASSVATALILVFYLSKKEGRKTGILTGLLYFLVPLSVFYLRVGVIEPFLVFGMVGAFCFFDLGRERRSIKFSVVSGLFFSLSLLTKYTILPIFFLTTAYFFYDLLRMNRNILRNNTLYLNLYSLSPLLLGILVFVPIFLYFYQIDPVNVKWQTLQVLGFYGGVKQEFRISRILDFPWFYSWPILVFTTLGFYRVLKNLNKFSFLLLSALLMLGAVLTRLPFYPRYALVLVPFLAIFAGLGLGLVRRKLVVIFFLFVVGANLLPLYRAFTASYQTILEDAVRISKKIYAQPPWVFSNYWPNFFADSYKVKNYSWVTYSNSDLQAFAKGSDGDSPNLLKTEGGVVFLDNLYADLHLTQPESRLVAIKDIRNLYKPETSVLATSSNFPFSRKFGNQIDIYIIKRP